MPIKRANADTGRFRHSRKRYLGLRGGEQFQRCSQEAIAVALRIGAGRAGLIGFRQSGLLKNGGSSVYSTWKRRILRLSEYSVMREKIHAPIRGSQGLVQRWRATASKSRSSSRVASQPNWAQR